VENFDCEEVDVVMICASLSVGRTVLIPVLRLSRTAMRQLVSGSFFVGTAIAPPILCPKVIHGTHLRRCASKYRFFR
jgi:hypothetical protein